MFGQKKKKKNNKFGGVWGSAYNHYDDRPHERNQYALIYLVACVMPTVLGDTALSLGDYHKALYYYSRLLNPKILVGMANFDYISYDDVFGTSPNIHFYGDVPYTFTNKADDADLFRIARKDDSPSEKKMTVSPELLEKIIHPMEKTFFLLRVGNAMLEWADSPYRTERQANIARAREFGTRRTIFTWYFASY